MENSSRFYASEGNSQFKRTISIGNHVNCGPGSGWGNYGFPNFLIS